MRLCPGIQARTFPFAVVMNIQMDYNIEMNEVGTLGREQEFRRDKSIVAQMQEV